jgi:hypothetical protein
VSARAPIVAWAVAAVALSASGARAGGDCLAALGASSRWSCHAQVSNGAAVDYCLAFTHAFGDDAGSRFFRMATSGPFPRTCTCRAKQAASGAAFGEDGDYLCLDRVTDTVETGKVARRRIAGETFNASAGVRTTFTCRPDPPCAVSPVIDPDLAPADGSFRLTAGTNHSDVPSASGQIDVAYLGGGCQGFATEAPTFVFDVDSDLPGTVAIDFLVPSTSRHEPAALVVVSPTGETSCGLANTTARFGVHFRNALNGRYAAWVASTVPGATVAGSLHGAHQIGDHP